MPSIPTRKSTNEEEEEDKKRELLFKFELLKKSYKRGALRHSLIWYRREAQHRCKFHEDTVRVGQCHPQRQNKSER